MNTVEYTIENNPNSSDEKVIRDGIVNFNSQVINEKAKHFSIFAKDKGKIIGGALIRAHSDALYIDVLWCVEKYRSKGVGTEIINLINNVARDKGLSKIFVDTYSFQAQDFYKKHSFYTIGTIPKYLKNHDRIFLRKDIFHKIL
ncbi:MAG: GNAT family N-acetyltransferase [Tatlockia sp.]|nr:GNAT family N-acetyltransferase [Tatlockia sp.]